MASVQNALPARGDVIAGKYQVEGTLGQGGMGAVFEVTHRVTGKRFALKWLLPTLTSESDAVKRFIREAQVAGRVDHPNIVEVYDVGQEGDSFFMVMELLQGEPLSARLARARRLSPAEACQVLVPVCEAVSAAHASGVIHRDLKPDNIFLCRSIKGEQSPKVLDFGISKMNNLAGEVTSSVTRAGTVMGTPHYMAPEQVRARPVDGRTDVYALGVILYELLSGSLPFPGDTYSDLVLRIMTESPAPLAQVAPGTPPALVQIVGRAMAREPDARFGSVAELGRALEPFVAGGTAPALSGPRPLGSNTPQRLHTPLSTESERLLTAQLRGSNKGLIFTVAAALVLVVGIGLVVAWVSNRARLAEATPPAEATPSASPAKASAAALPSEPPASAQTPSATGGPGELPIPRTVRVGPEPEPTSAARKWQPPPGSNEAPRPVADSVPQHPATPTPASHHATSHSRPTRHHSREVAHSEPPPSPAPIAMPNPDIAAPTPAKPARPPLRTPGLSVDDF